MELLCDLCPRRCGAARGDETPAGVCRSPLLPRIARAAAHFGEEPCICGSGGAGASQARQEPVYYTVRKGDTLWAIAKGRGMTLAALIALNPQIRNPNRIYPGEKVRVQ